MTDAKKTETTTTPITPAPITPVPFTKEQLDVVNQMIVGGIVAYQNAIANRPASAPGPNQEVKEQCAICQQYTSACQGKHMRMVVYPTKYPEFAGYFMGVKINGVKYLSGNEMHHVDVPACAVSTIINLINDFEQNEKTIKIGRQKSHNSGSIGAKGTGVNRAVSAWR